MERKRDLTCPEFIGIDEIYLDPPKKTVKVANEGVDPLEKTLRGKASPPKKAQGRKPSCIITDIGAGRVLELMPTIKMQTVKKFLSGLKRRERLQAVAMDLTEHFEKIVRDSFPGIPIVRDKAHVLTVGKEMFNKIRNRIANAYVADSERSVRDGLLTKVSDAILKELIKKERAKRNKVKKNIQTYARYFVWPKSNRPKKLAGEFQRIFRLIPQLKKSYSFLQKLYGLYEQEEISAAQARLAFDNMKKKLDGESQKYWKPFFEEICSYDAEIWAYFDSGLTNASTEAMNRTVRHLIAAGRGMRPERLRAMLLYPARNRSNVVSARDSLPLPSLNGWIARNTTMKIPTSIRGWWLSSCTD
jgi:transposase